MNCKNKKEHLFGGEIHGIIESVDKIIIQKKDWFYGKYRSQCTFSVPDVLSDYGGEISKKSYQLPDFRKSKGNPGKTLEGSILEPEFLPFDGRRGTS